MKNIGEFFLRSRWQTFIIALLIAFIPLLASFAVIIMALVTLRKGWQEGFWILLATIIPALVVFFTTQTDLVLVGSTIASNILVWLLAGVLHTKVSWAAVLNVATVVGVIVVIVIHVLYPDIAQWWQHNLLQYSQEAKTLLTSLNENKTLTPELVNQIASVATGIQISVLIGLNLLSLVFARWWQAILFNPEQLRPELHNIRIAPSLGIILLLVLLLAGLTQQAIAIDVIPVMLLPFIVAALSLIHYWVFGKKTAIMILSLFYIMTILLFPYVIVLLIILGMVDSGINLRARLGPKK